MKLRLEDSTVRIRLTEDELRRLNETDRVEAITELFSADGGVREGHFVYGVAALPDGETGYCAFEAHSVVIYLGRGDLEELNAPETEGVYLKRESVLPLGEVHRFMAMVEKDRPVKKKAMPEDWVRAGGAG